MEIAVMVVSADPAELRALLRQGREAGYESVQVWARYDADDAEWAAIGEELRTLGLRLVALGGYTNPLSNDPEARTTGVAALRAAIEQAPRLGCEMVVTWSGTRHATMFEDHPDNLAAETWADAMAHVREVAGWAEAAGVTVAIEPFHNHVARTPERLRDLVNAAGSPRIGGVMDPPNFLKADEIGEVNMRMPGMFATLGERIALVHAKDVRAPHPGETTRVISGVALPHPGDGTMDYALYGSLIRRWYRGPVVVEHITEETMGPARDYVVERMGMRHG